MAMTRGTIDERLTSFMASSAQAAAELDDKIANSHMVQLQALLTRAEGHSQQFVTLTTRLDGLETRSSTRFTELATRWDNRFDRLTREVRDMLHGILPLRPVEAIVARLHRWRIGLALRAFCLFPKIIK
ncbi:unnamed protein product [Linum trigynum]|uniref:Uncharacterized protein n=1 Tax=Linum trigynum TaxID=586398 RepID=A0AAV2F5K9_9ROSI